MKKKTEKNEETSIENDSEKNLDLSDINAINQTFEPDPWYVTLGSELWKMIKGLGLWIFDFLFSIVKSLLGFFVGIGKGIVKFGKWAKAFAIKQKRYFEESDTAGKVSYGVMGASYFKHKQPIKGVLYVLIEVLFIVFMVLSGGKNLHLLTTLGDKPFQEGGWDPVKNEFSAPTKGDNSILCLLFGLITVIIIVLFIILYFSNIKGANSNCRIVYNKKYHAAYAEATKILEERQNEFFQKCSKNGKLTSRGEVRKTLEKELGMSHLGALLLSRVDFAKLEKGDVDTVVRDLKLEYANHSHTYDKYNVYYEKVQLLDNRLKGYKAFEKITEISANTLDKKGNPNRKEIICEIVNMLEISFPNATVVYDDFVKVKGKSLEEIEVIENELSAQLDKYIEDNPERMDSQPYTAKKEVAKFLDQKFAVTIMAVPTIMATIICILPLIFTIFIAFTQYDGHHNYPNLFTWSGLENLSHLFVSGNDAMGKIKPTVWTLLGWTITWAIFATFLNYIFGMVLALLINKKGIKLKKLWRGIFVLSIAVPSFISLTCMGKLLSDTGAIVKLVYDLTGKNVHFISNYDITLAKVMIIIVDLWIGIPYTMLLTSGILMNIPEDLYESARIDGAGPFTQFVKITLPYMLFVTGPTLITQFIGNINNFNVIFFLTGGIKVNAEILYKAKPTDLLITWLYGLATGADQKYNIASVIGIFIFIVCAFFSMIFYSKTSSVQNEEDFQ